MQNTDNRTLILIRGLPGSGKSTLASLLSEDGLFPVFSIDQYFIDKDGNYFFDHLQNHLAYDECKQNTLREILKGTKKIFIDNTFTLAWEMEPYFKMAAENNYKIFVLTVENYHNGTNIHNITNEQLEKMASKYSVKLLP